MAAWSERHQGALDGLRDGLSTRAAAEHAGITRRALDKRRQSDPAYQAAWTAALSDGQANKSRRQARRTRRKAALAPELPVPPAPDPLTPRVIEPELVVETLYAEAAQDADRAASGCGLTPESWLANQVEVFEDKNAHPLLRRGAQAIITDFIHKPVIAERVRLAKAAPVDTKAPERVRYELPASPMRKDD